MVGHPLANEAKGQGSVRGLPTEERLNGPAGGTQSVSEGVLELVKYKDEKREVFPPVVAKAETETTF